MFKNDDFEEFIKKFKDYFKIDDEILDVEFYLFKEADLKNKSKLNSNNNGFKITYHYENGMDEPDIKIQGNIDEIELNEYLKNVDFSKIKNIYNSNINSNRTSNFIDAKDLSLNPDFKQDNLVYNEPYIEVHDNNDDYIELLLEVPGIQENDILLTVNNDKKTLVFNAENNKKRYHKKIKLPYKVSVANKTIDLNNGIITFKCRKR
ncbi:MAG: hypothetical protein KGD57_07455 [Candidatus Lokiarchaeota archaeon]|nr:hypothetical protein [Candidatus Lokiarchaeota archaeon]